MLLNEILDELQLTHKKNPNLSAGTYAATSEGAASIDQLGLVSLGLYSRYLGLGIDQATINVIGDNKKYARRNRLVRCDDSDHGNDASTADYALVCDLLQEGFSYADAEIIIRATRYREKFDEMRGKTTYLERTLDRAIESVEGSRNSMAADLPVISHERGRISIPRTPPPPRNYVWQGRIVAGHAYVLGGFGGVSKSQAALQLAAAIATGDQFGGVNTKRGSALLIFGEDSVDEISRRLGAYAALAKLSDASIAEVEKNVSVLGLTGEDTRLTATNSGRLEDTGFADKIVTAAKDLEVESGKPIRLIVLDHAGLFHGGDFNAREDVSLTMRIINRIALETGAAVLLLAHSPKSSNASETSDASAIAGSTTFVDQTRGAFILATMREAEAKKFGFTEELRQQHVSLATVKSNYGITGEVSWFKRTGLPSWEVGVLVPVTLLPPVKSATPNSGVAARIKKFIADNPGRYSKSGLRDRQSGKNGVLNASKNEVAAGIETLLDSNELVIRNPMPEERKKYGLAQQTKDVLDVVQAVN